MTTFTKTVTLADYFDTNGGSIKVEFEGEGYCRPSDEELGYCPMTLGRIAGMFFDLAGAVDENGEWSWVGGEARDDRGNRMLWIKAGRIDAERKFSEEEWAAVVD